MFAPKLPFTNCLPSCISTLGSTTLLVIPIEALPLVQTIQVDQIHIVLHDLKFSGSSLAGSLCRDFCVRVPHDCNEHIEEDNLNQEGRPNEEDVAKNYVMTSLILVVVELVFTQSQLILTHKRVKEPNSGNVVDNLPFICEPAQVDDVECSAESHIADEHNDEEALNACKCLLDQSDKEGRCVK